jgi:hypothetical protein
MNDRHRLPNRRASTTFEFELHGLQYIATVGLFPDGRFGEIFLSSHKSDSARQAGRLCTPCGDQGRSQRRDRVLTTRGPPGRRHPVAHSLGHFRVDDLG